MPIELLEVIASGPLPRKIEGSACVDKLRLLVASGLVEAELPSVEDPQVVSVVRRVTGLGRAVLNKHHDTVCSGIATAPGMLVNVVRSVEDGVLK